MGVYNIPICVGASDRIRDDGGPAFTEYLLRNKQCQNEQGNGCVVCCDCGSFYVFPFLCRTVLMNNMLYLSCIHNMLYNTCKYNLEERGSGLSVH
jgi:hypothetical protein